MYPILWALIDGVPFPMTLHVALTGLSRRHVVVHCLNRALLLDLSCTERLLIRPVRGSWATGDGGSHVCQRYSHIAADDGCIPLLSRWQALLWPGEGATSKNQE